MKRELYLKIIEALQAHQSSLFEQGHTFWHCDASDTNERTGVYMPFRYYQTNRSIHMSTCSTCYKLMELRKEIRKYQKIAGIEQTPLFTNHTEKEHVKKIHVSNSSMFNPNAAYIGAALR